MKNENNPSIEWEEVKTEHVVRDKWIDFADPPTVFRTERYMNRFTATAVRIMWW